MSDPDTTLTDFALAAEALVLALWLWQRRSGATERALRARRGFIALLAGAGAAALAGGLMHGFFPMGESRAARPLWTFSMLAFGVMALGGWLAGADIGLEEAAAAVIRRSAPVVFAAYAAVLLLVSDDFRVGLAHYAPAAVFLFIMFIAAARRAGPAGRRILLGAAGLAVTFAGSLGQALRIAVHPVHFDHNTVYHVMGMIGLALLCLGAEATMRSRPSQPRGATKDVPTLAS